MEDKITIMALKGGIYNAYKVFNMATFSLMLNKSVNIFFDSEAIRFVVKPEFYNLSNEEAVNIDLNNKIKKYGVTSINDIIEKCQKLQAKFFVIANEMKKLNIKEDQLIDGTMLSSETTFFRYAEDSSTVLYL